MPCEFNNNANENIPHVISKETAILIAKGATLTDYDFNHLDPIVIDEEKNWMVTFDLKLEDKEKPIVGGAPTVVVEKRNGSIVSISGTK